MHTLVAWKSFWWNPKQNTALSLRDKLWCAFRSCCIINALILKAKKLKVFNCWSTFLIKWKKKLPSINFLKIITDGSVLPLSVNNSNYELQKKWKYGRTLCFVSSKIDFKDMTDKKPFSYIFTKKGHLKFIKKGNFEKNITSLLCSLLRSTLYLYHLEK